MKMLFCLCAFEKHESSSFGRSLKILSQYSVRRSFTESVKAEALLAILRKFSLADSSQKSREDNECTDKNGQDNDQDSAVWRSGRSSRCLETRLPDLDEQNGNNESFDIANAVNVGPITNAHRRSTELISLPLGDCSDLVTGN